MNYNPPCALEIDHWESFNNEYKKNASIRYFIMNTLPHSIACRPLRKWLDKLKDYIRYRTYNRYHIVDTGLSPGYYEISEKLLHASFNLLKDFVEKEKAWMESYEQLGYVARIPFYYELLYRNSAAGIKYLEWESTLDDPLLANYQQAPQQAIAAREILALYTWWTETRPARITNEPPLYDFQGCDLGPLNSRFNHDAEDYKKFIEWWEWHDASVEQWRQEDDKMLTRLGLIRHSLWT